MIKLTKLTLLALGASVVLQASPRSDYEKRKALHALGGLTIAYTGAKLGYPKVGLALGFLAGVGKEVYDERRGGSFRCGDVAWTTGGAVIGFSISYKF